MMRDQAASAGMLSIVATQCTRISTVPHNSAHPTAPFYPHIQQQTVQDARLHYKYTCIGQSLMQPPCEGTYDVNTKCLPVPCQH